MNPNPSQTVIEPIEDELSNPPEPLNDDDSNSKSNKIKNRVKELISESTSHGITHFFRAKRNVFKVMWLVLFLTCISFGIRLAVANIATYLEYEVKREMSFSNITVEKTLLEIQLMSKIRKQLDIREECLSRYSLANQMNSV